MPSEAIRVGTVHHLALSGREVECHVIPSKAGKKMRIRINREHVEVVVPNYRTTDDGIAFLERSREWIANELNRARRLMASRRPERKHLGQLQLQGTTLSIRLHKNGSWRAPTRVAIESNELVITCGPSPTIPLAKSLENWLRKQARYRIDALLKTITARIRREPDRVYIMGQRTKWGNCSALGNLSFNWRLIMAPEFVGKYLVTHEVVHLAIPDHSKRFWLTVQSLCPESEKARRWLSANSAELFIDLRTIVSESRR